MASDYVNNANSICLSCCQRSSTPPPPAPTSAPTPSVLAMVSCAPDAVAVAVAFAIAAGECWSERRVWVWPQFQVAIGQCFVNATWLMAYYDVRLIRSFSKWHVLWSLQSVQKRQTCYSHESDKQQLLLTSDTEFSSTQTASKKLLE